MGEWARGYARGMGPCCSLGAAAHCGRGRERRKTAAGQMSSLSFHFESYSNSHTAVQNLRQSFTVARQSWGAKQKQQQRGRKSGSHGHAISPEVPRVPDRPVPHGHAPGGITRRVIFVFTGLRLRPQFAGEVSKYAVSLSTVYRHHGRGTCASRTCKPGAEEVAATSPRLSPRTRKTPLVRMR